MKKIPLNDFYFKELKDCGFLEDYDIQNANARTVITRSNNKAIACLAYFPKEMCDYLIFCDRATDIEEIGRQFKIAEISRIHWCFTTKSQREVVAKIAELKIDITDTSNGIFVFENDVVESQKTEEEEDFFISSQRSFVNIVPPPPALSYNVSQLISHNSSVFNKNGQSKPEDKASRMRQDDVVNSKPENEKKDEDQPLLEKRNCCVII